MVSEIANMDNFEDEIEAARDAHKSWRLKLETALRLGTFDKSAEDVASPMYCAFGTWMRGKQMTDAIRATKSFQNIASLHRDFHGCAARVVSYIKLGDREGARALIDGEFSELSGKLDRALSNWQREVVAERNRA